MELDEERGLRLHVELGIGVGRLHRLGVEKLDPGDRNAGLHRLDHRIDGIAHARKRTDAGQDRFGDAVELEIELGDDAERALRADQQPGQIIAGGGLFGPPCRADDLAVGHHRGQRDDVVAHRAVSDGIGARGPRRRHAAEAGIGAGIDREKQPGIAQMGVQRLPRDARLDLAVEILGVDGEHLVHA